MIISYRHKFIFIHIYKTAGTSVCDALSQYGRNPANSSSLPGRVAGKLPFRMPYSRLRHMRKHAKLLEMYQVFPEALVDRYYKFAFVRNPWDWLVSQYQYILENPHNFEYDEVVRFKGFDEYLNWRLDSGRYDRQVDFVKNHWKQVDAHIFKFEALQESMDTICNDVGLPAIQLPHRNSSQRSRDYRSYYTDKLAERVEKVFWDDVHLFKYTFDPLAAPGSPE